MDQNDILRSYVKSQLTFGIAPEAIHQALLEKGWDANLVDDVIAESSLAAPAGSSGQLGAGTQVIEARHSDASTQDTVNGQSELPAGTSQEASLVAAGGSPSEAGRSQANESYGVVDALKETYRALMANSTGILTIVVIGSVINIIAIILLLVVGAGILFTFVSMGVRGEMLGGLNQPTGPLLLLAGLYVVLILLTSALTQSLVGFAINEAAEGRRPPIGVILMAGLKRLGRVAAAMTLYAVITTGPLVGALLVTLVFGAIARGLTTLGYILAVAALLAGLYFAVQALFMVQVSLFEPDRPLGQLFARSKRLMQGGGAWFFVRLYLLVIGVIVILESALPGDSTQDVSSLPAMILVVIVGLVLYLSFSAMHILFYRNRRIVRG